MNCENAYKHVCFKDLENYIKRDTYFSDFTDAEKELIKKNLGIGTFCGTYDEIYNLIQNNSLDLDCVYVMNDFRSIYLDIDNNVCGTDDHIPSNVYTMVLFPNSSHSFDRRVSFIQKPSWIIEYDITKEKLNDSVSTKGKILYLKDNNNNYAYYDFKNIKFKKTVDELSKGPDTYLSDTYLYTFDHSGQDASELNCKNNHLEQGVTRSVFLGDIQNTTLSSDCHDNIFFGDCTNSYFGYGTYNNYFIKNVVNCSGSVNGKEINNYTYYQCPKEFVSLNNIQYLKYLDQETQTIQLIKL